MLQRIQSIFYLLVAIAFGALFQLPFATSDAPIPDYLSDQVYNIQDHFIMLGLTILGIVVAVVAIFMFRNRSLQIRLGYLLITIGILVPLVAFLLMFTEKTAMDSNVQISEHLGLFIPILIVLFAILGNRFVKKDDKLVKSMDRLR